MVREFIYCITDINDDIAKQKHAINNTKSYSSQQHHHHHHIIKGRYIYNIIHHIYRKRTNIHPYRKYTLFSIQTKISTLTSSEKKGKEKSKLVAASQNDEQPIRGQQSVPIRTVRAESEPLLCGVDVDARARPHGQLDLEHRSTRRSLSR